MPWGGGGISASLQFIGFNPKYWIKALACIHFQHLSGAHSEKVKITLS
jgi:hypothetical protein